ncbi:MAG: glycine cleavage system protein GcvH [Sphaerochaetaceae bacterium]|jgi:glycine cleavage system H protein|nr:glycine cleavage system protein GcvH [Sphaerochaetaceae bacterium]MDX9808773.1 glycine cleavage system protein GcvH [Sphaerochaetaceae bacterium]
MGSIPKDLRYSKDHEWVRVVGDKVVVGITDYAQDSLGEIVYVELPTVGDTFQADEEIANVESVKAASAIFNPVSGTVSEVNEKLEGAPELINEDCYANHLYTLSDFDTQDLDGLLDADGYAEYLKTLA